MPIGVEWLKVGVGFRFELRFLDKLLPADAGILFEYGKQAYEGLDSAARSAEICIAHALGAMLHKCFYPLVRERCFFL
jgi:hypothetical protein